MIDTQHSAKHRNTIKIIHAQHCALLILVRNISEASRFASRLIPSQRKVHDFAPLREHD
jgi:hypothetical protein